MTRPPVRGDADWRTEDLDDEELAYLEEHEHEAYADGDDGDDGEYEPLRREAPRGRRILVVLAGISAVLAVLAGVAYTYAHGRLDPSGPIGEELPLITIATGSTNGDIARLLEDEGVIPDSQAFELYLRAKDASDFLAGDYQFRANSAAWDALAVLEAGPLPPEAITFTVPEGLTVAEYPDNIVDDVAAFDPVLLRQAIAANQIPRPLNIDTTTYEGFLFPDTYQIEAGMTELDALSRMVSQFDLVANEVGLFDGAARLGYSPYEIVVIASLIQEEYGIVPEMPMIARVIYNRLDQGEPLGIDATSRYEAVLAGRDRNDIDLDSDSPYNTRRNAGLPPTPIAAPGRDALLAALNPADGDWIYYVRDPNPERTPPGGHFFTDSAAEFEAVKAECEAAGLGCG